MKFPELNIQNFLVITDATICLADRGLILIQGSNNEDTSAVSNGAGKSSIADALCWCIYGVTARGETGDAVVNNKAGKNTRVQVVIEDGAVSYTITRHRKHKTGKNNLTVQMDAGAGVQDLTKGTDKLTQDIVDKIIGASLEVFAGSIYAGQEKMPDLPSLTDKMLKMLIEEAAGINALEAAYTKARDNAKIAKIDLDGVVNEIASWRLREETLKSQLEATVTNEKAWFSNRNSQINELTDRVRNVLLPQAKQKQADAPQSEIDRIAAEIVVIDLQIGAVGAEQSEFYRLSTVTSDAKSKFYSAKTTAEMGRKSLDEAKKRLDDVDHKIGCPCNECGRPITASELVAAKASAQAFHDHCMRELVKHGTSLQLAQSASEAARSASDTFQATMTDVSTKVTQRGSLEAQRNALLVIDTERQNLIAQARNDMATIERFKQEPSPFVETISDAVKKKDAVLAQIARSSGDLAVKQRKFDLEQAVVQVFSPAGVRARVLDGVTPYLNTQTSKYLSVMSDGNISAEWSTLTISKAGDVKEKFAIDVTSTISSKSFKGLSGGEKRKVRLATALALQDLVATRASKSIDLFVGDEIDDALDASGLERLMIILEEKAKERGTVMVISHNSLRDEISNVIHIERTSTGDTKITESMS